MKNLNFLKTTLLLLTLSIGLSSCYMGYYNPGPVYRIGGGPYFKSYHGGKHHHHGRGHYHGGGKHHHGGYRR
jgi:hypothetical protein